MKKLLNKLNELSKVTEEILNYFEPDLYQVGIIVDSTDNFWYADGDSLYFGDEPPVLEYSCFEANYGAEIRGIYSGQDYTLIVAYHGCGGDSEMMIFSNDKNNYIEA